MSTEYIYQKAPAKFPLFVCKKGPTVENLSVRDGNIIGDIRGVNGFLYQQNGFPVIAGDGEIRIGLFGQDFRAGKKEDDEAKYNQNIPTFLFSTLDVGLDF
ncbi:hypothetical protein Tco_0331653 [Tanacetum coccineum]